MPTGIQIQIANIDATHRPNENTLVDTSKTN